MRPRLAFLTGQSDPGRCALSPSQSALLARLAPELDGVDGVPLNFPWQPSTPPWRPVPLPRASLANARQYLAARRGRFAAASTSDIEHARRFLGIAPRTLLLVGSCGLVLLDALITDFDDAQRRRLRVVSYGGVAPRWPRAIAGTRLHGRRDRIAAWLGPRDGPSPRIVDHGHMDYLDGDAVADAACAQLDWLRGLA
jgi:hypothetical protein